MSKLLLIGYASLVLLAGCNNETGSTKAGGSLIDIGDLGSGYDLMRDTNTGCIYIREGSAHSYPLTPYFNEEGKVAGCGEKDLDKTKYN